MFTRKAAAAIQLFLFTVLKEDMCLFSQQCLEIMQNVFRGLQHILLSCMHKVVRGITLAEALSHP